MIFPADRSWFFHRVDGRRHLGLVDPEPGSFLDLGEASDLDLLATDALSAENLPALMKQCRELEGDPVFDVPVARPPKILCLGKNYAAHAAEFGSAVPEEPIFFTKLIGSLLPHQQTVLLPHWVNTRIDHELELGIVLGFEDPRSAGRKYVSESEALDLVAGFTIINDVTARSMQGEDRGKQQPWLRCKSFDTFCPIGPWVVPRDSLPGFNDLEICLEVNGQLRQKSRTSLMVVDVAAAISYLSRHTCLQCGDVIATGTPEGVGPIEDGDILTARIEGIGELKNPVAREKTPA